VRADIESAIRWYQREDINLAVRFRADTQATLRRIAQNQRAFPIVRDTIRRAVLKKFPYSVYFEIRGDAVFVRSVVHQHRMGTHWLNRGNGRS
jgi:toxin ParE1/3/4